MGRLDRTVLIYTCISSPEQLIYGIYFVLDVSAPGYRACTVTENVGQAM